MYYTVSITTEDGTARSFIIREGDYEPIALYVYPEELALDLADSRCVTVLATVDIDTKEIVFSINNPPLYDDSEADMWAAATMAASVFMAAMYGTDEEGDVNNETSLFEM